MPDEAIKRRIREAKRRAIQRLEEADYDIIPSTNQSVCIVATRNTETRYIRVVIDEIKTEDIELIRKIRSPQTCSKEIWCSSFKGQKFKILTIN